MIFFQVFVNLKIDELIALNLLVKVFFFEKKSKKKLLLIISKTLLYISDQYKKVKCRTNVLTICNCCKNCTLNNSSYRAIFTRF